MNRFTRVVLLGCGLMVLELCVSSLQASVIDPIGLTATASNNYPSQPPANAVNGQGLSGTEPNQVHDNTGWNVWGILDYTDPLHTTWFRVALGAEYDVTGMKVWNFNQADELDEGIKTADIYVSSSGTDPGNPLDNAVNWTKAISNQHLDQAPGTNDYAGEWVTLNRTARYVAIVPTADYGANNEAWAYGLSEVRFYGSASAVPEPSVLALLITGLIGLLCYAWRKRQ